MNYRAVFIVFMGLVLIISLGMARAPKTDGQMAIDFTLADLEGVKVKLSDYKGKVVFLNFWATWCPPCRREMPSMQELHEKLKKKDFDEQLLSKYQYLVALVDLLIYKY